MLTNKIRVAIWELCVVCIWTDIRRETAIDVWDTAESALALHQDHTKDQIFREIRETYA